MKKLFNIICLLIAFPLIGKELTPSMFVLVDPDNPKAGTKALSITKIATEVVVHGDLAETAMTLTFYNNSERRVEGQFLYPLHENSIITGYALDIEEQMVDGVVVEKKRAQTVFNTIKRRMIDPGLVEWKDRNTFKTRVYPIFGKKSRTIRIKYLTEISDGKYVLPLNFQDKIPEFSFEMQVLTPNFPPKIIKGDLGGTSLKEESLKTILAGKWQNADLSSNLEVAIDQNPDYAPSNAQVDPWDQGGKDLTFVESVDDDDYFKITSFLRPRKNKVIPPEKITIIWDASGSRINSDHDAVFRKLIEYFEKHKDRDIAVDVKVFRDLPELTKSFQVKKGNYKELTQFLRNIYYDGATRLGVVKPDEKPPSFYLLVTDGKSVRQVKDIPVFNAPVFTISACEKPNYYYLKEVASSAGGEWINVLDEKDNKQKIGEIPLCFLSAEYDDKIFKAVFPDTPEKINGPFCLSGMINGRGRKIKLNFGYGNKPEFSKEFIVNIDNRVFASLIEKYQALKTLDKLLVYPKQNREKIIELGKKYGLVTPYTSLLVLESIDQYVEFRIPPPKSMPDMRELYFGKVKAGNKNLFEPKDGWKSAFYKSDWRDKVMWWNTVFKYKPDFKYKPFQCLEADFSTFDAEATFDKEEDSFEAESSFGITFRSALITRIAAAGDDEDEGGDLEDDALGDDGDLGMDFGGVDESIDFEVKKEEAPKMEGGIFMKIENPKPEYIKDMELLSPREQVAKYIEYRKFSKSPGFFLKCADFFAKKNRKLSLQILSNFFEMGMDNFVAKRIIANHFERLGELDQAIDILRDSGHIEGKRPYLLRDLALLYIKRAETERPENKKADYRLALRYLVGAFNQSNSRNFKDIILFEINNFIPKAKAAGVKYSGIPECLQEPMDMDLRIVVSGFGGKLEIVEPSGEKVSYLHPLSLTGGYYGSSWGLREYFTRKAMKGTYSIFIDTEVPINNFGSGLLKVDVYTNYGRPNQKLQTYYLDVDEKKKNLKVGEIKF